MQLTTSLSNYSPPPFFVEDAETSNDYFSGGSAAPGACDQKESKEAEFPPFSYTMVYADSPNSSDDDDGAAQQNPATATNSVANVFREFDPATDTEGLKAIALLIERHRHEWIAPSMQQQSISYPKGTEDIPWDVQVLTGNISGSFEVIGLPEAVFKWGSSKEAFEAWDCLRQKRLAVLVPWRTEHLKMIREFNELEMTERAKQFETRELPRLLQYRKCIGLIRSYYPITLGSVNVSGEMTVPRVGIIQPRRHFDLMGFFKKMQNDGSVIDEKTRALLRNQLVLGLARLHHDGYAHRDLNPANVLIELDATGNPVRAEISDFGDLSNKEDQATFDEDTCAILGCSPETLLLESGRTLEELIGMDLWGMGVILWMLETRLAPPWCKGLDRAIEKRSENLYIISRMNSEGTFEYEQHQSWLNGLDVRRPTIKLVHGLLQADPEKRLSMEQAMKQLGLSLDGSVVGDVSDHKEGKSATPVTDTTGGSARQSPMQDPNDPSLMMTDLTL